MSGVKGTRWGHLKPCPSWSAYKLHLRTRQLPCEPCRQLIAGAKRAQRAEAAYRQSVAEWRADHEASLKLQQERDIRALVALIAEAVA